MTNATSTNSTLDAPLEHYGWKPAAAHLWRLRTRSGPATLMQQLNQAGWLQLALAGGAIPNVSEDRLLAEHSRLPGPLKFVRGHGGQAVCRADVPAAFDKLARIGPGADGVGPLRDFRSEGPLEAWAATVTAAVSNDYRSLVAAPTPDASLVAQLREAGWTASLEESGVLVHLVLPGLFRAVRIEALQPPAVKVSTSLVQLGDRDDVGVRAALSLAQVVNERLPLVRIALEEQAGPRSLVAEVQVGCGSIHRWLPTALQVVEAAVINCARELRVLLVDRELAQWVLAACAVGDRS